jgi:3-phenylpropionate/cinnamic acid dioxygenase small subunit
MGSAAPADWGADDAAIRTLIARIAHFADWQEDLERYLDLFTDDAVWEFPGADGQGAPGARVVGRAAIRADRQERRGAGFQGPGTDTRHLVTTVAVDADGGDAATADSYWLFFGETSTAPTIRLMGRYRDRLVRTPEGWRLAHRTITVG